jgi:hypothetical protein
MAPDGINPGIYSRPPRREEDERPLNHHPQRKTPVIQLTNASGLLKKLSNNLVGADNETIFTLPICEIALDQAQVDELLGKFTFRSWFNNDQGVWRPMDWVLHAGSIPIEDKFDVEELEIIAFNGEELLFESTNGADDEDIPAGRITSIQLKPCVGGVTMLSFHLQVRPGRGKKNAALQNSQEHRIKVTLGDVTAANAGKGKQQDLGLQHSGSAGDGQETRDAALAAAGNGDKKPIDGTTSASRAKSKDSAPAKH